MYKINIFKNKKLYEKLEVFNNQIIKASKKYKYARDGEDYDLKNDKISQWFDPELIKKMPTSRTYPNLAPEQLKQCYNLVLYNGNYLGLFLIDLLYNDKNILIEDIGAGVGHLIVYLNKLGFNNFNIKENFSQMSKNSLDIMMNYNNIKYQLNDDSLKPVIVHNSGVPDSSVFRFDHNKENLELIICYYNLNIKEEALKYWESLGYTYLCEDEDQFAFAFCKNSKYEEFFKKIKEYGCSETPIEVINDNIYGEIIQYEPRLTGSEGEELKKYMNSGGWISEFSKTKELENNIKKFLNVKNCFMVNNGTISLSLALLACDIKPNDHVIVPNITMIATANAVKFIGATPIFIDVNKEDCLLNLDKVEEAISKNSKIKAVIYVSLNGRWDESGKLMQLFETYKDRIKFIEDSAQSFGSKNYRGMIGNDLHVSSFSFSMPKIISCGQGGCLTTNIDSIATKIKRLKDFGRDSGGIDKHDYFGINSKFTELQAIVLLEQLKEIDFRVLEKKKIYSLYNQNLKNHVEFLKTDLSFCTPWFVDVYFKDEEQKNKVKKFLNKNNIQVRDIYPPLNTQKIYKEEYCSMFDLDNSKDLSSRGFWLPSSFSLTEEKINYICNKIKEIV